ncbi:MAG: hypothetical protein IPH07_24025 [Deltaproteobacteria bacterium]|nr:hypothetical protein [Deltaproteobacteria bacterium]MBK8720572.1 hypothetical protein [Deltaproteobacteria bacterium]
MIAGRLDDLFIREEVSWHEFADDPREYDAPPRCRVSQLEPIEVSVDYTDEDGTEFECVVALDGESRAAWVDAWVKGDRVELDADQREAIVRLAMESR